MTDVQQLLEEAVTHHEAGQLDTAEHLYHAVLALAPDHAETAYRMGALKMEQGLANEGVSHFKHALQTEPENGRYWLGLAQGLAIAERPDEALIVLDKAESMGLDSPVARELREAIGRPVTGDGSTEIDEPPRAEPNASDDSRPVEAEPVSSVERVEAPTFQVTLVDNLRVLVPATLDCRMTYLLMEHEDWPDESMPFIRRLIRPGMLVLDVGSSHGVYALSMAKQLRGQGRIIALEPAWDAVGRLARGIGENGLQDVVSLLPIMLSDRCGETRIAVDAFGLRTGQGEGHVIETAKTMTVSSLVEDECWPRGSRLDVLRLDASVDPMSMIEAAEELLVDHSPLLMLEIAPGVELDPSLRERVMGLGMDPYRFIPGLNVLAPLDEGPWLAPSAIRRTIFVCPPARADGLRQRAMMV